MEKFYLFLLFLVFIPLGCEDPPPDDDQQPPTETADYWQPWEVFPDMERPPAELLQPDPLPEIGTERTVKQLTAEDLQNPNIFETPGVDKFVLPEGDFSEVGRIVLNGHGNDRRVIIEGSADPFEENAGFSYLAAFDIQGGSWIFNKIFFRDDSGEKFGVNYGLNSRIIGPETNNNTFNRCRWENAVQCIRVVNSSFNTFQFNAVPHRALVPTDGGFVSLEAAEGMESRGNRIIFNEVKDLPDGIGGTPWSSKPYQSGSTPGTVFAFNVGEKTNRVYKETVVYDEEGNRHVWCSQIGEDGSDQKNGGRTEAPEDRCWYYANVSFGSLPTATGCKEDPEAPCASAGSSGVGIGIWHNRAQYWNIWGNLSLQDIHAIFVKNYNLNDERHRVKEISIKYNVIAYQTNCFPGGIAGGPSQGRVNENNGLAFRVICETCTVSDNIVAGTETGIFTPTFALFENNLFAEIDPREPRPGFTAQADLDWVEISVKPSPLTNPEEVRTYLIPVPPK
jgi:hypothetical protein